MDCISQRHKGKWEPFDMGYKCSLCGLEVNKFAPKSYRFCPNCGSDMRNLETEVFFDDTKTE